MRIWFPLLLLLAAVGLSCGGEDTALAARAEEASRVGLGFITAVGAEHYEEAVALTAAPLRWRSARADKDEELLLLVKTQGQRSTHMARRWTLVEAFSRAELEKGRWPRGRELSGDAAAKVADGYGVVVGGYLVRVHSENDAGCLLAVNPSLGELRVQTVNDL